MTLEALLASRDARVAHQARLLGEYPGMSLLCLTVMLPGPEKRSSMSLKIASEAVVAVRSRFEPLFEELRDLETGYEGYFIVDMPPLEAKLAAVALEDSHPLGRLFDLDVIVPASFSVPSSNKPSVSSKLPVFKDENQYLTPVSSKSPVFKDENRFDPSVSTKSPVFKDENQYLASVSSKLPVFKDGVRPLGREELGLPQRACIICGKPVRECMRTRAHTTEELLERISVILKGSLSF